MSEAAYLLRVDGVSKSFPGVKALSDVSLEVYPGEILAMVGENGAGKSTLIQILSGALQPDSGRLFLQGQEQHFHSPSEAEAAGISTVYQELSLVPNLSVAENIFAARQPTGPLGLITHGAMYRAAQDMLDQFQVSFSPRVRAGSLSLGNQQLIEIAKALSRQAKVLILDEPTSSLSLQEANLLFGRLQQLKQQGMAIVYVSHHLEEVFAISDRTVVLRDGQMVGSRVTAQTNEREIVGMMVGRELGPMIGGKSQAATGPELLRVSNLSRRGAFEDVSFSLHAGEILAFFGLVGAGRTEVARALMGLDQATGGQVWLRDQPVKIFQPGAAMRLGLAYLSEDRKREGLFLDKTILENFLVSNLRRVAPRGWLRWDILRRVTTQYTQQLDVRTPSLEQKLRNLSGGNQQKVMLGIWLATEPDVLLVDEPTRGIDVGTKQEIHRLLRELAEQGKAIMMISSDLPEALGLSDRIAVMRKGRLVSIFSRAEATQERVMEFAAGVTSKEVLV